MYYIIYVDSKTVKRFQETCMDTVKISPKYQVVIPKKIRKTMGIKPGEKVQVFQYGDRIEYIPVKKVSEMRGFAYGIDTDIKREGDRE